MSPRRALAATVAAYGALATPAAADLPTALPPGNLLTNSSFDGVTTLPWVGDHATLTRIDGQARGCGGQGGQPCAPASSAVEVDDAAQHDQSDAYGIASGDRVQVHPGYAYTAAAWVAATGKAGCLAPGRRPCGTNGEPIQIVLRELDAFGQVIRESSSALYSLGSSYYKFVTVTMVAVPAGATIVAEIMRVPPSDYGATGGGYALGANGGGAEGFLVDQFSLIQAAPAYVPLAYGPSNPGGNLTSNPAFEDPSAGTSGWVGTNSTLTRILDASAPTESAAGVPDSHVARVALAGPVGERYGISSDQQLPVLIRQTYTATAWVKADGSAAYRKPIELRIDELGQGGTVVAGASSPAIPLRDGAYQQLRVSYTASGDPLDMIRLSVVRPAGTTVAGDGFDVDALTLTATPPCAADLRSFGPGNWPPGCWRPYASSAAVNTPIPVGAAPIAGSPQIVSGLLDGAVLAGDAAAGGQAPLDLSASSQPNPARPDGYVDPLLDGGTHPTFWATASDPRYVIDCTAGYGGPSGPNDCPAHQATVSHPMTMPATALPAGYFATGSCSHDAHMTVLNGSAEYDLWCVQSITAGVGGAPGTITAGWAGTSSLNGNGFGGGATAGSFDLLAGVIRAQELEQGQIDHALFLSIPCAGSALVAGPRPDVVPPVSPPGLADNYCTGSSAGGIFDRAIAPMYPEAMPMGTHLRLGLSDGMIENLPAQEYPPWEKAIMLALSSYGAYVGDTGGVPGQWGFQWEGGTTYTSFTQGSQRYVDELFKLASAVEPAAHDYNQNYCPSLNLSRPADPFTAGSCPASHADADEYYLGLGNIDWTQLQVLAPVGG